jgi:hypothetical protein
MRDHVVKLAFAVAMMSVDRVTAPLIRPANLQEFEHG